jgi:diguanylate cyclase (GGDEF)-like protein
MTGTGPSSRGGAAGAPDGNERGRSAGGARTDRAHQALADIARRARATNTARAQEVESVLMAAVAGQALSEAQRRSAERAAHMVAGSAGTIGMHQVSELARELEATIAGGAIAEPAGLLHALALLREIQRQLDDESGAGLTATEPTVEGRHEILVVTADDANAARIEDAAQERGWAGRWALDSTSARAAIRRGAPDVVVLDAALEPLVGSAFLPGPSADRPRHPSVVIAADDGPASRTAALLAGADAVVGPSLPPEAVVAVAIEAAGLPPVEPGHILVLADPATASAVEAALAGTTVDLTAVTEASALAAALTAGSPDAIVLAVGSEDDRTTCRDLKADPVSATLPVIALVPRLVPDDVAAAFAAGADDVVPTPLVTAELLARVVAWIERARLRRTLREVDPLTRLTNRRATTSRYAALAEEAQEVSSPLSVAMIDIDGMGTLNDEHGYAFGDIVLERLAALLVSSFRERDVVGRWAGQEFLVVMRGLRRADGVARIAAILESLRNHQFVDARGETVYATFRAAVAEHGVDGRDLPSLVRQLNQVLASAKRAGGNRVLPVGWTSQTVRNTTDVFIVEDDEMLAGLLQQALDTRGLRSEHEVDGKVALERLIGPNRLTARVILLDVDLPGMNGLDVLRRLEAEGVLAHSHVIMLTAYAGEQDVITAMRHGAFDHAAKPFSLPVLTQRLRRALDSLPPP